MWIVSLETLIGVEEAEALTQEEAIEVAKRKLREMLADESPDSLNFLVEHDAACRCQNSVARRPSDGSATIG